MIARLHADDIRSYANPVVILAMGARFDYGFASHYEAVELYMKDLKFIVIVRVV